MEDGFWNLFFAFSWVWIPITAILVGGFMEYLKFKSKQRQLGVSAEELEKKVAGLQEAFERRETLLLRRIENLEAIVTTQAWDALHNEALPEVEKNYLLDQVRAERIEDTMTDEERIAVLARRMKS